MNDSRPRVLLTGCSGFVGSRLLRALTSQGIQVRCMARSPEKLRQEMTGMKGVEVVKGDLLKPENLPNHMESVDAAYYLIHSMAEGRQGFAERDRQAAANFVRAADEAGVKRIIYLGGLGRIEDELSRHLSSRHEVADILGSSRAKVTVLRAPIIIGAGGAPFEMLRYLVENLPVMVCPRWVYTLTQPIAIQNVVEYLAGCLHQPETAGMTLDIGGPEITTYFDLMRLYARVRGLHRFIFTVPLFTPSLSAYWVELITPVAPGIVRSLIEGLKNEVIARENRIRELIPTRLTPMDEAICTALMESEEGPGKLRSRAECRIPIPQR